MKSKKYVRETAKSLFRASITNGNVDEKKAIKVVSLFVSKKPANLLAILRLFKNYILDKQKKELLIIEAAHKIDDKNITKSLLQKSGADKIVLKINPTLVYGVKISHGDWVYDATLTAKLKQLVN